MTGVRLVHPYSHKDIPLEAGFFLQPPKNLYSLWDYEEVETLGAYRDCFYEMLSRFPRMGVNTAFRRNLENLESAIYYFHQTIKEKWAMTQSEEEQLAKYGCKIGLKQAIREGFVWNTHLGWEDLPEEEQKPLWEWIAKIKCGEHKL